MLENFIIAKEYYFYPTKLLYKGAKLDYWIFQFAGIYGAFIKSSYINFNDSIIFSPCTKENIYVKDFEEFKKENMLARQQSDYDIGLMFSRMVLV